ncbi:MAG: FAD-binding protein [Nitrospiraceae bacterium]|nr:FAD-binding protein [Nitrospiraceae bacterium]
MEKQQEWARAVKEIARRAREKIPSLWVWDDLESRLNFATDRSAALAVPDLVVLPSREEELLRFMELIQAFPVPLTPQGARTGMSGGAVPVRGGIAISMLRMRKILSVQRHNRLVTVHPGVITGHLHRSLEKKGFFYPPDPASLAICTLGGNIAEDAGGPRAVKYGVTHDYVLGLRVLLSDGRRLSLGGETLKDVAGYRLASLFTGSEGTLGIITRATLRILPLPQTRLLLLCLFPSMASALTSVQEILFRETPSAIEFMDRQATRLVRPHLPLANTDNAESLLLIEIDGIEAVVNHTLDIVSRICHKNAAISLLPAKGPREADKLWDIRRNLSPALYRIAPTKLNHDIVVPLGNILSLVERLEEISKDCNTTIASFGHVGDGNLHVNLMTNRNNPMAYENALKGVDALFNDVLSLHGSISGEHGIGLTKKTWLPRQLSKTTLSAMRQVKDCFDPIGIMNPGKIFLQGGNYGKKTSQKNT